MTPQPHKSDQSERVKTWALHLIHAVGYRMWTWADDRLALSDGGPRCPDCQIGPDVGPDVECGMCRDMWRQQKADEAIYGAAFEDGYRAGASEAMERMDGPY